MLERDVGRKRERERKVRDYKVREKEGASIFHEVLLAFV